MARDENGAAVTFRTCWQDCQAISGGYGRRFQGYGGFLIMTGRAVLRLCPLCACLALILTDGRVESAGMLLRM